MIFGFAVSRSAIVVSNLRAIRVRLSPATILYVSGRVACVPAWGVRFTGAVVGLAVLNASVVACDVGVVAVACAVAVAVVGAVVVACEVVVGVVTLDVLVSIGLAIGHLKDCRAFARRIAWISPACASA